MRLTATATSSASPQHEREERDGVVAVPLQRGHRHVRRAQLRCLQGSRGTPGGSLGGVVIDTLRLTAEEASGLLERGEVSPHELHRAYLDATRERDAELHAYLCTV